MLPRRERSLRRLQLLVALAGYSLTANAQDLEFPISPSPVGSGARAAGMADAFISLADDATAASWNPAGLVQLERPEISIVGASNVISEKFQSSSDPELESDQRDFNTDLNFLSVVYPVPRTVLGRNVTIALTYQQKYDLSRKFDVNLDSAPVGIPTRDTFDFEQDGSLNVITPAAAIELTKSLSLGVAVNIWRDAPTQGNSFEQTLTRSTYFEGATSPNTVQTTKQEYENFEAVSVTAGLLWNFANTWNLGLRYDSGFTADTDYTLLRTRIDTSDPEPNILELSQNRDLVFPSTYSFGISKRIGDRLTMAFDMSFTDWDDFYVEFDDVIDVNGMQVPVRRRISLIDGSDIDNPAQATNFDTTVTARLGAEYVFIPEPELLGEELPTLWSIRGGVFFDQEPASGRSSSDRNAPGDGEPDDFYGFALGFGCLFRERFNFDFAYQFRYGNDVNSDFVRGPDGFDFAEDVVQHRVLLSAVIYF